MRIARLRRIRDHRIFRSFSWPDDLDHFRQFNLIYGWNGTGKTTLSNLLAHLERRANVTEGNVVFEFGNEAQVNGTQISSANVIPQVRVFNRDFVQRAVQMAGTRMNPIYYLGQDSAEKQARADKLKTELSRLASKITAAEGVKASAEKSLDRFCKNQAKAIKDLLTGTLVTDYNRYNRSHFQSAMESLEEDEQPLPEADLELCRKQKEGQPKQNVGELVVDLPGLEGLEEVVRVALQESIVSQTLDELRTAPVVARWVHEGMGLHAGDYETGTCRFCSGALSETRLSALEGHFNDAFARFQQQLDELLGLVARAQRSADAVDPPDEARFYDQLQEQYQAAAEESHRQVRALRQALENLSRLLERKKANPFEEVPVPEGSELDRAVDALRSAVEQVNETIREHNRITVRFEDEARSAYLKLERHYLALARAEYQELIDAHAETAKNLALLELHQRDTRSEVEEVEREIQKHQKPAEELNRELSAYLGRDELRFAVKENGYTLNRGGKPVNDLSEGERTSIAFLYFLKTLQDQSFDMKSGVIVVDDPVSSLDANALFSAFSYLKERVGDCGQLFVLTHNFAFFRRVRDWFLSTQTGPKKSRRSAGFYQLRAGIGADGVRSSALTELDPLLKAYDSEYHYLFKRVYDGATEGPGGSELEHYYSLPNVARCLIESFLGFRYPDGPRDNLTKLIERVSDFDAERRTRVCRFLHARSHGPVAMDPEHDPTALAETRAVLKDVLELMKTADRDHYDCMVNLVAPEPAPAASETRGLAEPGAEAS